MDKMHYNVYLNTNQLSTDSNGCVSIHNRNRYLPSNSNVHHMTHTFNDPPNMMFYITKTCPLTKLLICVLWWTEHFLDPRFRFWVLGSFWYHEIGYLKLELEPWILINYKFNVWYQKIFESEIDPNSTI